MRPSVSQLVGWDPAAVSSAGEGLRARAQDLQRAAGDLVSVSARVAAAWEGAAGDAAVAHHDRRAAEVDDFAAALHSAGGALQRAGDALGSARRQLLAASATAAAGGYSVSDSGAVSPPALPEYPAGLTGHAEVVWRREVDGIAEHQAGVASRLSAQIDAALSAADVADSTAGSALAGLVVPVISPPPTPVNQAALAGVTTWAAALGDLSALLGVLGGRPDFGSARLEARLERPRALGQTPAQYAELLQQYWETVALERAGIHPAGWQPELGVDHNRETVLKVYEYYRGLYEQDPTLQWAGLANYVGPGFAAAFMDLDTARDAARRVVRQPLLPPGAKRQTVQLVAGLSNLELRFYETTFLTMQQDIFLDIGAMHQAYLAGPDNGVGMRNLEEMAQAGLVRSQPLAAWRAIDRGRRTGSPELLGDGAVGLADHEQNRVIAQNWDAMRERSPTGAAVTYLMTVVGKPSVPGTRFPGQVRPLPFTSPGVLPDSINTPDKVPLVGWNLPDRLPLPPDDLTVTTPLPDFNVSVREDRWDYFLSDTMPAYERLLDEPGRASMAAEMARPLQDRIAEQRTWQRLPDILRYGFTSWSLDVE